MPSFTSDFQHRAQYYEVPREAGGVGEGWTVLVWCRAFGVPIANATQQAL